VNTSQEVPKLAHWLFVFACVFTWPLLFLGGLVTSYRVGMAVPDWPTTFGINMFLFNFFNSAWGVFIEHGHRLYGSAVGFCLLIVAPWTLTMKKLAWQFKAAAVVALLGVILQGVLGGLRVTRISTELAMIHGCFGQLFFLYLAILAAWSSDIKNIDFTSHGLTTSKSSLVFLRNLALLVPLSLYFQVVSGAWLRHFQDPMKLYLHEAVGLTVFALSVMYAVKLRKSGIAKLYRLRRIYLLFVTAVHVQVLLGFSSWWLMRPFDGIAKPVTDFQALVRTVHQANGALVLALSGVLAVWVYQIIQSISMDSANSTIIQEETVCLS
jgi:cytochrome c oxidase assembly protein subunit 15